MAAILKVDSLDLSAHLRVNQGDGLDPHQGGEFLEPTFAEAPADEGEALISVTEHNRQQAFPVILNPAKAGYADTKDGLHQLVRDINRALSTAQTIEWADDGASASTFFDAVFARFEPAYDFRRSQKHWLPGVVRVWARPFGTTGTDRFAATAVGTGVLSAALTAIEGDEPAQITAIVNTNIASVMKSNGFLGFPTGIVAAVAVMPTMMPPFIPPASLGIASSFPGPATLIGASGAIASQARRVQQTLGVASVVVPSAPPGDYRILGLVRVTEPTGIASVAFWAQDARTASQAALGPTQTVSLFAATFNGFVTVGPATDSLWRVIDLGVAQQGTLPIDQLKPFGLNINWGMGTSVTGSQITDFGGLIAIPDDSSMLTLFLPAGIAGSPTAGIATFSFDQPNRRAVRLHGGTANIGLIVDAEGETRGDYPAIPIGTGQKVAAFVLANQGSHNNPCAVEIRCRERFTFARV